MDISRFSADAQALIEQLEATAQQSLATRGFGYAQIREEAVGGLGPNPPADPDVEWEPSAVRLAVDELRAAGVDIRVSGGESMRMIALHGVRLQAPKAS
jgi:hypothetical protein